MGAWNPGQHFNEPDPIKRAKLLLADCIAAKDKHRNSDFCKFTEGGSPNCQCCTCHFWAGAIHALEEVVTDL